MKKKIKIAVLAGGPSNEWQVSMKSGMEILKYLPKKKYDATLVRVGRDGRLPENIAKRFDVAFVAMHGKFGEDGRVQSILETIGLPYTGSGVLASALGMDKVMASRVVAQSSVPVPREMSIGKTALRDIATTTRRVKKEIGYPCVVKPNESGSSVGVSIVRSERELVPALKKSLKEDASILVQRYLRGREMTCGVLGNRGGKLRALPPVEIIPHAGFFDYNAKYDSKITEEICPARISKVLTKKIQELSIKAHAAIGADGLTRSDFILIRNKFYFLEINTSPGMTAASLCPKEAAAFGWSFGEFLDRIITLAI